MKFFKQAVMALAFPCLLFQSIAGFGQKTDKPITTQQQKQIIDSALRILKANYIFPAVLPAMEKQLQQKVADTAYAKFTTVEGFLKNLNADLEQLSNDRHINIFFDPVRVRQIKTQSGNGNQQAFTAEFIQRAKYENFMVRKAERLDGNVGYIKFNAFVDTVLSKNVLLSTMNFVANSNALIIDLRQNGGGNASTLAFLLSYFLPDSTVISEERSRATASVRRNYLVHERQVNKFSKDVPVYILVSKRTSSAAEAFAYTLQSYKRATVVGEITNGEANPGYLFPVNDEMYIMVPAFENINPITRTNWQGKGVAPDISIESDKALTAALAAAYKNLSQLVPAPERRSMYASLAADLQASLQK